MSRAACAWIERDEVFEDYGRDALGSEDRDLFEAHYFECAACFSRLQTHLALQAELAALPPEVPAPASARTRPWWWVLAPLAATCVVVAAAALWFNTPSLPASPAVVSDAPPATTTGAAPAMPAPPAVTPAAPARAPMSAGASPREAVRKSAAASSTPVLLSPSENETRPAGALEFSWRGVPGAAFYELHIVTEDGNVVWSGKAAGTMTKLPDGHGLQAGTRYFVWVRAHLSGGGTAKSPAVPFRVSGQ